VDPYSAVGPLIDVAAHCGNYVKNKKNEKREESVAQYPKQERH